MGAASRSWLGGALWWQTRSAACVLAMFCLARLVGVPMELPVQVAVLLSGMVLVGVPHGAFDHLVAGPVLRPLLGRAWWLVFGAGYVGLAGLVGVAWAVVPGMTLAAFLAASIVHFGLGDVEDGLAARAVPGWLAIAVYGSLPVLLPIALHPDAAAPVLAGLAGMTDAAMLEALRPATWVLPVWGVAFAWVVWAARQEGLGVAERLLTAAAFVLLPPLLAFGLYFSVGHAMRHVLRVGAWHAPGDGRAAALWLGRVLGAAMVVTAVLLSGLFWGGADGVVAVLVPVFRGIAALTLPHMIVTAWLTPGATRAS